MAFEIEEFTNAKLTNVNVRSEKNGPNQLNPATDLFFKIDAPNSILSQFDGHLLSAIYHRSAAAAGDGAQQALDGIEQVSDLPNLRFPSMRPIEWGWDLDGYTLTIGHGLGGASDIPLTDCKVDRFKLTPREGGTVEVKFRVRCSNHLTEKAMGKLALLVQNEVPITLIAPATGEQQPLENPFPVQGRDEPPTDPFHPVNQQTPEDAFAAAVAGEQA